MAEKRLDLVIDGSKARKGAVEAGKALTTIKNDAKDLIALLKKAEGMMSGFGKNSGGGKDPLRDPLEKGKGTLTEYEKAVKKAEKAIQSNYNQLKIYNSELGKELSQTSQMLDLRKKELKTRDEERHAQDKLNKEYEEAISKLKALEKGYGAQNQEVKQQIKLKEGLARAQARLKIVQTDEYRQLSKTRKEIDKYTTATDDARKASRNFERSMMGIGIAASMFSGTMIIQDLIRTADAYTELQNKLAVVTGSTQGLVQVTDDLVKVSVDSRTSLAATTDLYSKLTRVNKEFGYSQEEVLTLTETVSKAVAMSGASASAAEGAVIQFAQALAGDFKTAGQELNSILEQTPGLSEAIAEGLSKLGKNGEVTSSQLKKMAAEGLLSTKDVLEGLIAVSGDVNEKFALSLKTVAQAWTGLTDSFTVSLGKFDQVSGATQELVDILDNLSKYINESQVALGSLIGLMSGGAALAILGTVAALTSLVGLPVVLAGAGFLSLSTAIGAISAKSLDTRYEVDELVNSLSSLDEINKEFLKVEQGNLSMFDFVGLDKKTKEELSDVEKALSKLNSMMNDPSFMQYTFGIGMEDINKEYDDLITKREALLTLIEQMNITFAKGEVKGEGLGLSKDVEKALDGLKDIDKELWKFSDPEKYQAWKTLRKGMDEVDKIQAKISEVSKKTGMTPFLKDLQDSAEVAEDQIWLKYSQRLGDIKEGVVGVGEAWTNLEASLKTQVKLFDMNSSEASVYTVRMEAMKAVQSDYQAQLDKGIISQETVNQKMRDAADDAENLQKALNRLNAEQQINNQINSIVKPTGGFGQLQDVNKQLEDAAQAGYLATEEEKATLYANAYSSINTAFVDAIEDGNVAGALYETFKGSITKSITDSLVADGMGGKLAGAVGAGIANSIGQIAGGNTQAGVGGLIGTGIGSAFGPMGAAIGSSLGSVLGNAFKRETKQTGSGYRFSLDQGNLASADLSESFKRSGGLFSSTKRWTEYSSLSIAEMDSFSNSLSVTTRGLEQNARLLGSSFDDYTGTIKEKNGSLSDGLDKYADMYANQGLAALEKYQFLGEAAGATFSRLAQEALTLSKGFELTGLGSLSGVSSSFRKNYEQKLVGEYEDQIASQEDVVAERKRILDAQDKKTFWGSTRSAWKRKNKKYKNDLKELKELQERLADVSSEASTQFNEILYGTLEDIGGDLGDIDLTQPADAIRSQAKDMFSGLSQSFFETYFTEQEQLQKQMEMAKNDLEKIGAGIDVNTSVDEIRNLYDTASSPDRIASILAAAEALSKYNAAIDASKDAFRQAEDSLFGELYTEAEKKQRYKDRLSGLDTSFDTGEDELRYSHRNYFSGSYHYTREDKMENVNLDTSLERLKELYDYAVSIGDDTAREDILKATEVIKEYQSSVKDVDMFSTLPQAFLDNYYSQQEQFKLLMDQAKKDLEKIDVSGIDINTSVDEIRRLYDEASNPDRVTEILAAAEALAKYNEAISASKDAFRQAEDSLFGELYTEAEKKQRYKDRLSGLDTSFDTGEDESYTYTRKVFERSGLFWWKVVDKEFQGVRDIMENVNLDTSLERLKELYDYAVSIGDDTAREDILKATEVIKEYQSSVEESFSDLHKSIESGLSGALDNLISQMNDFTETSDKATTMLKRQRAEQILNNALAGVQATGSVTVTQGLKEALDIISRPSEELYSNQLDYMRSLGGSANIIQQLQDYGLTDIPQFAAGGAHAGGARIVGEVGAEMEVTGASRIFSAQETRNMFDTRPLQQELVALRRELAATQIQLVRNSTKLNSDVSRMREDVSRIRQQSESDLYD